jgi:ArsR family transcriptional regulator, lead/cadmium/zinc/bismuth-responsive transcriptional repressor
MNRNSPDRCQVISVNRVAVARAKQESLDPAVVQRLADIFKVLGDQTRIKILSALAGHELCVCDLAAVLEMSSSAVSHQLRILRGASLVKYRRDGKMVFYSLDDEHVAKLFEQGLEHVGHTGASQRPHS